MRAKRIIEETFDIVLSDKHPYHTQITSLDVSGDLGSRKKLATVLFRFGEILDTIEKRLDVIDVPKAPIQTDATTNTTQPDPNPPVQS